MTDNTLDKVSRSCKRCGVVKPLTEFNKNNKGKFGYTARCKDCLRAYGKKHYKQNRDRKAKSFKKIYQEKREERLVKARQYGQSEQGKQTKKLYAERLMRENPNKIKAISAVHSAVKSGKLIKEPCEVCDEPKVDFHHSKGYDEENWLVGQWLCRPHHAELHAKLRKERLAYV